MNKFVLVAVISTKHVRGLLFLPHPVLDLIRDVTRPTGEYEYDFDNCEVMAVDMATTSRFAWVEPNIRSALATVQIV